MTHDPVRRASRSCREQGKALAWLETVPVAGNPPSGTKVNVDSSAVLTTAGLVGWPEGDEVGGIWLCP